MKDNLISIAREFLLNEGKVQLNEAEAGSEYAWTKENQKDQYKMFLMANEGRTGKPMINGGLKSTAEGADEVNGKEVKGVIYLGNGWVTFKDMNKDQRVAKLSPAYLNGGGYNSNDGTVPWAKWINFGDPSFTASSAAEFKEIARAAGEAAITRLANAGRQWT